MPKIHQFNVHPDIPERLSGLEELAHNLRWTWEARAQEAFRRLDPVLMEKCGDNPVSLLRRVSRERLKQAAGDEAYLALLDEALDDLHRYLAQPGWFQSNHPGRADTCVAYFCMEYGLTACLPIYSGGLGVLAGDHLKSASGLGLPLVAVGLLYNKGYFIQQLDQEGWQQEEYRGHDFSTLPVLPVMVGESWPPTGTSLNPAAAPGAEPATPAELAEPLKVAVEIADRLVWARVWRAQVGRISLYLLDSALPENDHAAQRMTDELYGGGPEERLSQELLLGIGGMRALKALGVSPDVCHLNEGHSVFASLERIRAVMVEYGLSFLEARQGTGAGTLFTTHTPVPAGFDLFSAPLIESHLATYIKDMGLDVERFMNIGQTNRENTEEEFNVAVMALRHSPRRNAVSRLHRRTTADMMKPGWAHFPRSEMPIESVTNGVHTQTWVAHEMADLYDRHLGAEWRFDASVPGSWERVAGIPDEELWRTHVALRERLVAYAQAQAQAQARGHRAGRGREPLAHLPLRGDILTIGFARRFATYKRATLLLHDVERLKAIVLNEERPVQFVMAGKAHPRDGAGKDFIREMLETVNREGLSDHVVFVEDYDLRKAGLLVQGADVWLNTPRRPYEACGTSGMKVVPNGGLNLSVLDGWWVEGYRPGVGWAIGDGQEFAHSDYQDEIEADSLYTLLEREVVPLFYQRDEDGLPRGWIAMMKKSIGALAPVFSGDRMVRQYAEQFYLPAAARYRQVSADGFAKAKEISAWKSRVRDVWCDVRVTWVDGRDGSVVRAGEEFEVTAKVALGCLDPSEVVVEVYTSRLRPDGGLRNGRGTPLTWAECEHGEHVYRGMVAGRTSGTHGYTVRVLPRNDDVLIPNELPLIAWEE